MDIEVPPEPQLLESMRAIGYTVETAIADLIDNSITAGARRVDVFFKPLEGEYVAVLDDGSGMAKEDAVEAMRLAASSASTARGENDLGRFGLGLKTASLSQCRSLTLATKQGDTIHAFRWSLDHVVTLGTWSLQVLSEDEISGLPRISALKSQAHGTLVIWQDLDQFHRARGSDETQFTQAMADVADHLGLVFHRFMEKGSQQRLRLFMNGKEIRAADPFLQGHPLTQRSPLESLSMDEDAVLVQAFTLPHVSQMSADEVQRARVGSSIRDRQGFYVYRNLRLVIWGTWFRVQTRTELTKLTRVRVDIPNSLDRDWSLDVKKSTALPPPAVLKRLRHLAEAFVTPSRRTQRFRGRPAEDSVQRLWLVNEDRDGFAYKANRSHPLVLAAEQGRISTEALLTHLENSFPVMDAHLRLSGDEKPTTSRLTKEELVGVATVLWSLAKGRRSPDEFIQSATQAEPFHLHPLAEEVLQEVVK